MQTAILIGLLQIIIYFLLTLALYILYYIFNIQQYSHYFVHLMLLSFIASYLLIVVLSYFLQKKAPLRLYQSYLKGKQKEEWILRANKRKSGRKKYLATPFKI